MKYSQGKLTVTGKRLGLLMVGRTLVVRPRQRGNLIAPSTRC